MTLREMQPGQKVRIEKVDAKQPGVVRLMVLGLVEGAEIQFENAAIGGDPMEVSVFGTAISIRKQQAGYFSVTPLVSNG